MTLQDAANATDCVFYTIAAFIDTHYRYNSYNQSVTDTAMDPFMALETTWRIRVRALDDTLYSFRRA